MRCRCTFWAVSAVVMLLLGGLGFCDTWQLGPSQGFERVDSNDFDVQVSRLKQAFGEGDNKKAMGIFKKLVIRYPALAGEDFYSYIEAEIEFGKNHYTRAVRKYIEFLDKYPKSAFYEAALDRLDQIGTAYLHGRKKVVIGFIRIKGYAEGIKIMERIIGRDGDGPLAQRAAIAVAEHYEKRHNWAEAYDQWSFIHSRWPGGDIGKKSLLAMGRTKHAGYQGPRYDASWLVSAKSYYQAFAERYPVEAAELKISEKIQQIDEQMAYKQLTIAKYYQKTKSGQAANLYYQMIVDDWPQSVSAQAAQRLTNTNVESGK
ncbi:MAG: outer membrane protein assembly factor BamD [Phycisphaerae bacterium]|nr:outer membrane protein assembly factor BamD [Phycisphaerae bacterium]